MFPTLTADDFMKQTQNHPLMSWSEIYAKVDYPIKVKSDHSWHWFIEPSAKPPKSGFFDLRRTTKHKLDLRNWLKRRGLSRCGWAIGSSKVVMRLFRRQIWTHNTHMWTNCNVSTPGLFISKTRLVTAKWRNLFVQGDHDHNACLGTDLRQNSQFVSQSE